MVAILILIRLGGYLAVSEQGCATGDDPSIPSVHHGPGNDMTTDIKN